MPIRRSRAVPLAAALCLVLAVPTANAAGFMNVKDTPIIGELPPPPALAAPRKIDAPTARNGGGDLQNWQSQYGTGPAPSANRPGTRTPPGARKTK